MAMLTTKDVCEQLSISRSSVGRLVALGDLPCYQLGIDAYLDRCRVKVSPAITCAPVQQPAPPKRKRGRPIKNTVPEYYPGMKVV